MGTGTDADARGRVGRGLTDFTRVPETVSVKFETTPPLDSRTWPSLVVKLGSDFVPAAWLSAEAASTTAASARARKAEEARMVAAWVSV